MNSHTRKSTNLSLDQSLLAEARLMKVNLSRAAEDGVRRAVAQARSDEWLRQNAEAIASSNRYADENGLPLDQYRSF